MQTFTLCHLEGGSTSTLYNIPLCCCTIRERLQVSLLCTVTRPVTEVVNRHGILGWVLTPTQTRGLLRISRSGWNGKDHLFLFCCFFFYTVIASLAFFAQLYLRNELMATRFSWRWGKPTMHIFYSWDQVWKKVKPSAIELPLPPPLPPPSPWSH